MRWGRPSASGRRLALQRKYELNTAHYGGPVMLVTLTPPGEDLLPFGDECRVIDGESVQLVEHIYREAWNVTAQHRASRLYEAAQRSADRLVRRGGWKGQLPRQLGMVRAEQKRGVWHFHYELPMATEVERVWSRQMVRFLDHAWRSDQRRWPDESVRRDMVWNEYVTGRGVRGFYGFGFVHKGSRHGRESMRAARYLGRNAAGYMASNAAGRGFHYVSSRLTRETGVTMAALRSCNWLYVRRKLIAAGELDDEWVPTYWSPDKRRSVLGVWAILESGHAP